MQKFSLFAFIALFNLLKFIDAAPRTLELKTRVRYDGAQLWNVHLANANAKHIIDNLQENFDISIWSNKGEDIVVFLKQSAIERVKQVLKENDISYSIVNEDVQKLIDQENPAPEKLSTLQRNDHPMTWNAYHRLDDIFTYLDYLVATYPDLCSLQTIGNSHDNRPLKVLKISNGNSSNKAIWIDGGIHAREWISPASVTYIVNDLVENWKDQPEYIQNINWYVLPVHNPDGYEYTHEVDRMWRKNRLPNRDDPDCAGVDLNRNFESFEWGGQGTSQNPCSEIYAGSKGFSEPESSAVKNFFDQTNEKFYAYLTYHSFGQYILYPWGYDKVLPDDHEDLDRVGKEAAANIKALDNQVYQVGSSAILLYPAAGGSDDWGKSIGIKYSYTVELRDTGRYGFILPAELIVPTAKEAREFVLTVSRAVAKI